MNNLLFYIPVFLLCTIFYSIYGDKKNNNFCNNIMNNGNTTNATNTTNTTNTDLKYTIITNDFNNTFNNTVNNTIKHIRINELYEIEIYETELLENELNENELHENEINYPISVNYPIANLYLRRM